MEKNGIETILGRQEDTPLTIKDRCNYMLKEKVDYFISIHTESPKREKVGMRLFISQFKSDKLNQINGSLADLIIESLKAKQKELVVERIDSPLLISDNTNIPGILIEIFPTYKNNSEEEDWDILLDKKSTIADTIAESLNKYRINMEKSQKNE
jgi:N-acetylmuramoyl-L-alanine amidase